VPDLNTKIAGIDFVDFWPGFDKCNNFVISALKDEPINSSILVTSVFPSPWTKILENLVGGRSNLKRNPAVTGESARSIWYTGENLRPPVSSNYDAFISFDQDTYRGKNFYFPLLYVDLLFASPETVNRRGVVLNEVEQLTLPRAQKNTRKKFACAFLSNPEPTRLRAIEELRKFGTVDVFGPYSKRPVASKYEVARDYKYCLAFENDLYPGYVTEKLLDAYLCGTVPLYWGSLGREPHINRQSFVNSCDFDSLEHFAEYVGGIKADEYDLVFSQPLLKSVPSKAPLIKALLGT
jgi:hypothetical protein